MQKIDASAEAPCEKPPSPSQRENTNTEADVQGGEELHRQTSSNKACAWCTELSRSLNHLNFLPCL